MRIVSWVPLSNILIDRKLPINLATLDLANKLRDGMEMNPVHLQPCGPNNKGKFKLKNGRHRFVAAKLLGWTRIPAKYSTKLNRKLN